MESDFPLTIVASPHASGQLIQGTIDGNVTDASQAAVAGAKVVATNLEQRVKGWVTSAGYVGTRAIDPQNNIQVNWSPIGGGTAGEILNQLTGRTASTQLLATLGTNTYDGLQTRAQRRFAAGYQITL